MEKSTEEIVEEAKKWRFPWHEIQVLVGGRSAIDLPRLSIKTREEAINFLSVYGFNVLTDSDRKKLHSMFIEAVHFLEKRLIPKEWAKGLRPPSEVLSCQDVCQLILWASQRNKDFENRTAWSCSILRIMHTSAHVEGFHSLVSPIDALGQIKARFDPLMHPSKNGKLFFGKEGSRIELMALDWKEPKTRHSILLKLLHKPKNVAETIHDLLGLRVITKRTCDVVVVLKMLKEMNLIALPNTHPGRARNNLVNIEDFQDKVDYLREELLMGRMKLSAFRSEVAQLSAPFKRHSPSNPHSSGSYKSIQLTCRQMVKGCSLSQRHKAFMLKWCQENRQQAEAHLIQSMLGMYGDEEMEKRTVFFPFEVQIMDGQSWGVVRSGKASHTQYKGSQIRTARKRILPEILSRKITI